MRVLIAVEVLDEKEIPESEAVLEISGIKLLSAVIPDVKLGRRELPTLIIAEVLCCT